MPVKFVIPHWVVEGLFLTSPDPSRARNGKGQFQNTIHRFAICESPNTLMGMGPGLVVLAIPVVRRKGWRALPSVLSAAPGLACLRAASSSPQGLLSPSLVLGSWWSRQAMLQDFLICMCACTRSLQGKSFQDLHGHWCAAVCSTTTKKVHVRKNKHLQVDAKGVVDC